jgi:two-component system, OmpR family, sensor histidine kinase KdpD
VEENADRLDSLIGNLLDMSRLQTGSLAPFLRPTAVDEVAPVALRGLDDADRLVIVVPDGLPLVKADPGLLERVLANLFSNALRHSPPDQPPALVGREAPAGPGGQDRVIIEVIDHGPGVPAGQRELIFEPFQRLDERSGGVGLGLSVARGFTEAMGGTIEAAGTPHGGLTMRLTLLAATSGVAVTMEAAQ